MKELTLKESQHESLKVLIEIRDICNKHGWTYYLTWGTLIGAARHQGFIPWDDDIDILIPRSDFTQFVDYMENEYTGKLVIHTRSNTKNYPWGIPRVSNDAFQFVSKVKQQKPYELGVFVDIYPLDNWCSSSERSMEFTSARDRLSKMYRAYMNPFDTKDLWKIPLRILKKIMFSFITLGVENKGKYVDDRILELVQKYTSDDDCWVGCPIWCDFKTPYEKKWFENSVELEFEHEIFSAPAGYDSFLRRAYGDYMQLPPEDKRVPSHDYKILAPNDYVGING